MLFVLGFVSGFFRIRFDLCYDVFDCLLHTVRAGRSAHLGPVRALWCNANHFDTIPRNPEGCIIRCGECEQEYNQREVSHNLTFEREKTKLRM